MWGVMCNIVIIMSNFHNIQYVQHMHTQYVYSQSQYVYAQHAYIHSMSVFIACKPIKWNIIEAQSLSWLLVYVCQCHRCLSLGRIYHKVFNYVNIDDFYWYTDTPLLLFATCMLLKAYH